MIKRILFVEDNSGLREALTQALGEALAHEQLDVAFVEAGTAAEARERLREGRLEAALIDITLSDGNGLELVGEINDGGVGPRIPTLRVLVGVLAVLLLTGFAAGCGQVSDRAKQDVKKKVEAKGQQVKQEAKKKVEAKEQQAKKEVKKEVTDLQKKVDAKRQEVRKKVEAGQEDLNQKVDDLQKKVEDSKEDLAKKLDDVQKDVNDLEKKVDELLKKVGAQEQQDQKK